MMEESVIYGGPQGRGRVQRGLTQSDPAQPGPGRPDLPQDGLARPGLARPGAIGLLVLAAHVGAIALFALGAYVPRARQELPPVTVEFLTERPAQPAPPRPADPELVSLAPPAIATPNVPVSVETEVQTEVPAAPPASAAPSSINTDDTMSAAPLSDVAYLEPPMPRYPPESKHAREEGMVILKVLIDEAGHASSVHVYRSSGHPRLDEAACKAVQRARFKPHLDGGIARAALAIVPIEFSLHGAGDRGRRSG